MGSDPFSWDDDSQWETISSPNWDDEFQWEPISPPAPQHEPSYLDQWENAWVNKPLWEGPSQAANYIAQDMDDQTMRNAASGRWDAELGLNDPWLRGLASGSLRGLGGVLSGFTSPLNLATMGAFKGAGALAESAPMAARALGIGGRALSAPVAAGGAAKMYDEVTGEEPIDWTRFGMAGTELAGGIAGLHEPIPSGRRPTAPVEAAPPPPFSGAKTLEDLLPPDVVAGFTPEQRVAVQAQFDARQPIRPPGPIHGPDQPMYPSLQRYYDQAPTPAPMFDPNWAAAIPDTSPQLGFGAYRGAGGRFASEGPGAPPKFGPPVGEVPPQSLMGERPPDVYPQQGGLDLPPSEPPPIGQFPVPIPEPTPTPDAGPMWPAPAPEPAPVGPAPSQPNLTLPANASPERTIISLRYPKLSEVRRLLSQGYVSIPERGPNGEVQMVYGGEDTPPSGAAPAGPTIPNRIAGTPEIAGPARPGIQTNPDGSFTVPKELVTEEFMRGVQEDGLDKIAETPTHVTFGTPPAPPTPPGFFQRMLGNRGAVDVGMPPNEGAMTIPSDISTLRQQNILNPPEAAGPIELDPTQTSMAPATRPVEPLPQYPPRPLRPGETHQQRLAESRQRVQEERAELDAIKEHGVDRVPPEVQRTGLTQHIKSITKELIEDETGTLDIPALMRRIRELAGRGDEVDNVSPRQQENNLREITEATTIERARDVRNAWRDRISLMSDRERQLPEGVHAEEMFQAARQRVIEFSDAENAGRQVTGAVSQPTLTPQGNLMGDASNYAPSMNRFEHINDIDGTADLNRLADIRMYWQDQILRASDAEPRQYARQLMGRANTRINDLRQRGADRTVTTTAPDPTSSNAPYRQSTVGQQADIREIAEITTPRRASELVEFWQNEIEGDRRRGDLPDLTHSEAMLRRSRERLAELDPDGSIVPEIRVFDAHTGRDVRSFFTEEDAQNYVDAHPNQPLDWEGVFEGRRGGETARGFEVVDNDGSVVTTLRTAQEAIDYIDSSPDGRNFYYRQAREGNTGSGHTPEQIAATEARHPDDAVGFVPDDQQPLPPSGGTTVGGPRLNRTPGPRPSPTSADIPGHIGVYEMTGSGEQIRVAGFDTYAEADRYIHAQRNRWDLTAYPTSMMEGQAAAYSANTPFNPTPSINGPVHGPNLPSPKQLREATGDLFPPVTLGKVERNPESGTTITREQGMRLRHTAMTDVMDKVYEANEKLDKWSKDKKAARKAGLPPPSKPHTVYDARWEGFRGSQLSRISVDPTKPGLHIEQGRGPDNFLLKYRGPDGAGVGFAEVDRHPGALQGDPDFRYVPALAATETPLGARAFREIGLTLRDMNALDTGNDYISVFTGRAIAKILEMFKDDAGYVDITRSMEMLKTLKEKVMKGGSKVTRNVMDVYSDMNKLFSKKKTDLKWLSEQSWNKAKEFMGDEKGELDLTRLNQAIRNEEGAIDVGAGINKVWNAVGKATGWGQGGGYKAPKGEMNTLAEALAVPSGATTMLDASFPGRQGIGLIATPEFWGGLARMPAALHYDTWKKMDNILRSDPIMVKPRDPVTGKLGKSIGDEIGTEIISPASELGPRGEATASRWLETGGSIPYASAFYRNTAGVPIRATNRMFVHMRNHLTVNRTRKLMDLARAQAIKGIETGKMPKGGILGGIHIPESIGLPFSDRRISMGDMGGSNIGFKNRVTPDEALGSNPYHNLVRGKEIADFVNTAMGQGPLKMHVLPWKKAEVSLESAADKLGYAFFSPKLIASRMRMMNPNTYIMASPFVRRQYLKSAIATATAWFTMAQMMKMAAGPEAQVGDDFTSADAGKLRIGDARLDLSGGFSQFAVALSRLYVGGATSSASGVFHRFGSGYQAQTNEDMMERFFVNKLNPVAKFAWDIASASEYKPFQVGDRTMQMFVPLLGQDLYEIYKEDPSLLPMFGGAAALGGGTQIYGKGEAVSKFIQPENDWTVTGGGVRDIMPWNWGAEPGEERNFPWSEQP